MIIKWTGLERIWLYLHIGNDVNNAIKRPMMMEWVDFLELPRITFISLFWWLRVPYKDFVLEYSLITPWMLSSSYFISVFYMFGDDLLAASNHLFICWSWERNWKMILIKKTCVRVCMCAFGKYTHLSKWAALTLNLLNFPSSWAAFIVKPSSCSGDLTRSKMDFLTSGRWERDFRVKLYVFF